jgi:hypothetical protein
MYVRKTKASLYIRHSQKYCECRVTGASIVYVIIQLHFDMAKGNGGLMYNGGDLIHDHLGRLDSCRSIPAKTVILSCFNHHSLSSVVTIRRETTHEILSRGIRWLYRSSLFVVLRTRAVLALKLFKLPWSIISILLLKGSSKLNWDGHPSRRIRFIFL